MNERYKRLADEALNYCVAECVDSDSPIPWIWERKYAELVIQECIDQIIQDTFARPYSEEHIKHSLDMIDAIREHFGIEGGNGNGN